MSGQHPKRRPSIEPESGISFAWYHRDCVCSTCGTLSRVWLISPWFPNKSVRCTMLQSEKTASMCWFNAGPALKRWPSIKPAHGLVFVETSADTE